MFLLYCRLIYRNVFANVNIVEYIIQINKLSVVSAKLYIFTVYENSEDIAMASNMDSVYSNTGHKDQDKEERGYKVILY